jgi:hypothetical protein
MRLSSRPTAKIVFIQLLAAVSAWMVVAPLAQPVQWGGLAGLITLPLATMLRIKGLARWGCLLFLPLVGLALSAHMSPWVYFVGLLLTLGFGRNALAERVPLYRSSEAVLEALAERLPQGTRLLEAGCGDARLVLELAKRRPDIEIIGVENAWLTWCWARLRWWRQGRSSNVRIQFGNFWELDWSAYNAIYVFLSPEPMARLWRRFLVSAAPGSLLLSNSFAIPGVEADETLALGGPLQQTLLIWHHPHGA